MLHSGIWLVALVEILECLWSLCLQVGHQTINAMMHVEQIDLVHTRPPKNHNSDNKTQKHPPKPHTPNKQNKTSNITNQQKSMHKNA
jgi:hypothetical protein